MENARLLLAEGLAVHTIADNDGVTPQAVARGEPYRRGCVGLLEVIGEGRWPVNGSSPIGGRDVLAAWLSSLCAEYIFDTCVPVQCLPVVRGGAEGHTAQCGPAVANSLDRISKTPERVGVKTEAQQAREEAAPTYLRGRVGSDRALPGRGGARARAWQDM